MHVPHHLPKLTVLWEFNEWWLDRTFEWRLLSRFLEVYRIRELPVGGFAGFHIAHIVNSNIVYYLLHLHPAFGARPPWVPHGDLEPFPRCRLRLCLFHCLRFRFVLRLGSSSRTDSAA